MTQKIVNGAPEYAEIDADVFLPKTITFGNHTQDFMTFLLNNSWFKPRDIIRFLKAYAKTNPEDERITEEGTKKCLNEYARISAVEIFEQISVNYSPNVIAALKNGITRREYANGRELSDALKPRLGVVDMSGLMEDLFDVGIIGNMDIVRGKKRWFWSHREEENLDWEMRVAIHPGLWNYFNIRHR